jgi:hypothetical protein
VHVDDLRHVSEAPHALFRLLRRPDDRRDVIALESACQPVDSLRDCLPRLAIELGLTRDRPNQELVIVHERHTLEVRLSATDELWSLGEPVRARQSHEAHDA